ncbi:hypothetical protein OESDEN_11172 [Oesophagostomum dentatum]|uniref:Uncharacterized protein n=1 Tax=Oesophagostomum dentatum TaxID=61180 RepID=A0A0B1SUM3_OESDE|nr:hypothetical protein OESDEN_11172 [Oesophagostomum dentatum]
MISVREGGTSNTTIIALGFVFVVVVILIGAGMMYSKTEPVQESGTQNTTGAKPAPPADQGTPAGEPSAPPGDPNAPPAAPDAPADPNAPREEAAGDSYSLSPTASSREEDLLQYYP